MLKSPQGSRPLAPIERDIVFHSEDAALAGSLMLPDTPGPHPAVVFIHGSGQQVRDSHRSLAAHFVNQGIAGLIYDKRGCGDSAGNWLDLLDLEQSFPLLARDAAAGLRFLRDQVEIDADQTGYYGFSQGGWLGPLAVSTTPDAAFVICVSGPGVTPDEQVVFTIGNHLSAQGLGTEEIDHALSEMARASVLARRIAATGEGWVALKELFAKVSGSRWSTWVPPFSLTDVDSLESNARPFIEVLRRDPEYRLDPVPALENLACPVLAIWGEADQLVPVERSVAVFRGALERSENTDFTLRVFPEADHGMRLPDGSMAPGYLEAMTDWLSHRVEVDRGNSS